MPKHTQRPIEQTQWKYPGVPREEDKRIVLSLSQIADIRRLYATGKYSHRQLANDFGVSSTTIRYYVVDNEVRNEINKKRYARIAERVAIDPVYADKRRKQKSENTIDLMKRTDDLKKYKGKATYRWKKKKYHTDEGFREKTKEQSRNRYYLSKGK